MLLSALTSLLLLPAATQAGVHKLKLHKIKHENVNPALETAYLTEKYGGQAQLPMLGAGGMGRQLRVSRPSVNEEGEDLLWTQEMINGGHNVPLSSKSSRSSTFRSFPDGSIPPESRLYERPVLHDY